VNPKLVDLIKKMQKDHGAGSIKIASDTSPYCPRIPTGIFPLDYATGGGIPIGRTSMVFGKKSAGKSGLCAKTAASAQRLCRKCYGRMIYDEREIEVDRKSFDFQAGKMVITREKDKKLVPVDCVNKCRVTVDGKKVFPGRMKVVWVDAEGSFTPDFYTQFGVDCDDVLLCTPDYGESAIDMADSVIRLGEVDLLIVDSIAHLIPMKEREASTEDNQMGLQARLVNKAMRLWTASLNEVDSQGVNDCAVLLVNQLRQKISLFPQDVRPGGVGQEYATSLDIHLWQKEFKNDTQGRPLWMESKFAISKNRVGVPQMEGIYRMCLLAHPGRKQGDTWDDEAVADAVLNAGLATYADKGDELTVLGRKFANADEFRAEITKRGEFYDQVRDAVLDFMINLPSDGKLAEKKKRGEKKDDKGGKGDKDEKGDKED
jgi:RecA/RadA recombinase